MGSTSSSSYSGSGGTTGSATSKIHRKVVVCYVQSCAQYRPDQGAYSFDGFDPKLCTHMIYSFVGVNEKDFTIKFLDDSDNNTAFVRRLLDLKKTNPDLLISVALGGWNEGCKKYSDLAADSSSRKRIAKNARDFIVKHKFDGLDLDWEFPADRARGGKSEDRANFTLLVKDLKDAFEGDNLLLTAAICAEPAKIEEAYDIRSLAGLLDFVNVMSYDYYEAGSGKVGANAPFPKIKATIDHLKGKQLPPAKIVMGLPFYGRTFIEHSDKSVEKKGFKGPYLKDDNHMAYNGICATLRSGVWEKTFVEGSAQAYARQNIPGSRDQKVIVYDTSECITAKVKYAVENGLGGLMVWSLDMDDFRTGYPLMKAICDGVK